MHIDSSLSVRLLLENYAWNQVTDDLALDRVRIIIEIPKVMLCQPTCSIQCQTKAECQPKSKSRSRRTTRVCRNVINPNAPDSTPKYVVSKSSSLTHRIGVSKVSLVPPLCHIQMWQSLMCSGRISHLGALSKHINPQAPRTSKAVP